MFWVICFQNAALPQLFLRVLDPSLKPMRLKTQKSIQGLLYSPLLKHRLYWHIGKNFKDVRSFLPEKNGQSLLQEKKVHDLVILSCPENSQPPKIKETAPGTVYIYIYTWKSRQQVNKIQLQSAATFFEFSGCQSLLNWHWFWIKSLSIQTEWTTTNEQVGDMIWLLCKDFMNPNWE